MDKPALETVESGKGMCLSKLRGVPYPRATDAHSKSGLRGLWEDMRTCLQHKIQQRSCVKSLHGMSTRVGMAVDMVDTVYPVW